MTVGFSGAESDELINDITDIADVAEFRVDLAKSIEPDYLRHQIRRLAKLPVLLTIRIESENGHWSGNEIERAGLFSVLVPQPDVKGADVEVESGLLPVATNMVHSLDKIIIGSAHDFDTTPSLQEMEDKYGIAIEGGADYFKLAAMANTASEYERLEEFTFGHHAGNVIVLGMGEYGPKSRIELFKLGSRMTYASNGEAFAPGQMTYLETHERLKQEYPDYAALFE